MSEQRMEEGTILSGSWGYDQTNAEFWRVVKRTAKQVEIVKIGASVVEDERGTRRVVPNPEEVATEHSQRACAWYAGAGEHPSRWTSPDLPCFVMVRRRRKIQPGERVRLKSYLSLSIWDEKPQWDSAVSDPGGGH